MEMITIIWSVELFTNMAIIIGSNLRIMVKINKSTDLEDDNFGGTGKKWEKKGKSKEGRIPI